MSDKETKAAEEDRFTQIERENRRLLAEMEKIVKGASTRQRPETLEDRLARKAELKRITAENKEILLRVFGDQCD